MLISRRPLVLVLLLATSGSAAADWANTLEDVARAVVSVRTDQVRPFDGSWNSSGVATAFVVDAERGILLTNRHVVNPGPSLSEALFLNHEEVALTPLYRDPVHDFGFYRYDPAELRFLKPKALVLAPELARVGTDIRVVGNDAGEKLSILSGIIARLDRPAPSYGPFTYSDFNTFYLQAAAGTSGGSSGSPVVDVDGRVLALNAGGRTDAMESFYLPLDRVARALALIKAGEPVTRGTLQAVWAYRPHDELRRLGMTPETEAVLREEDPLAIGALVLQEVVPRGPADGKLKHGDILLTVAGERVRDFVTLEAILDESVGQELEFGLERGGVRMVAEIRVQDLHSITPDSYLEIGGATLHDLSYIQARSHAAPIDGVYLAAGGHAFDRAGIPARAVIHEIGGERVRDLDDAERFLSVVPAGEAVQVRYSDLSAPGRRHVRLLRLERRWFEAQRCFRNDSTGFWDCVPFPTPPAAPPQVPATASFADSGDARQRRIARSLVTVSLHVPHLIDGVHGDSFVGTGVVVDAGEGLVVVDRSTVAIGLGDVRLTFAGSVDVPGEVRFLHPLHDLAVVSYDPALLGETPIATVSLATEELESGDPVWYFGVGPNGQLVTRETRVSLVRPLPLPAPSPPRFQETNLEVLAVEDRGESPDGVLVDRRGRMVALFASFSYDQGNRHPEVQFGIPSEIVAETVAAAKTEGRIRTLGAQLGYLSHSIARQLGLSPEWIRRLEEANEGRRRALHVVRLVAQSDAARWLREGDLLVAIDGKPMTTFRDVELAERKESIRVTVLRNGQILEKDLKTLSLSGQGTGRLVRWAGAYLQEPHLAVAAQRGTPREGVYISRYSFGSPASRAGLSATTRIVEVDGQPTPDLDTFLAVVSEKRDREACRLKMLDLNGRVIMGSLRLDLHYWPTVEIARTEEGWVRTVLTRQGPTHPQAAHTD